MRFAPGNLAAIRNSPQPSAALRAADSTTANSAGMVPFGFLMRQQIPLQISAAIHPEEDAESGSAATAEENPAPLLPGIAPGELRSFPTNARPQSAKETISIVEGRSGAQPGLTQPPPAFGQAEPSGDLADKNPSSFETPGAAGISTSGGAVQDSDVASGAAKTEIASPDNSGSDFVTATLASVPGTLATGAQRSSMIPAEEHVYPAEGAPSPPKTREVERTEKLHPGSPHSFVTGTIPAEGASEAAPSAVTVAPAAECHSAAQPSGFSSGASVSSAEPTLRGSRRVFAPTRPQPDAPSTPGATGGVPPDRSGVDPRAQGETGARGSMHNASAAPIAAAQQRISDVLRPAAGTADSQHPSMPAGSVVNLPAGFSAPHSLSISGPSGSTVPVHSSAASSDPGFHPSAAFERMDGAQPVRILESSPQKLEVGVRDAGLGWIEIRTHAVAGQVAATVAAGTHEAHAAIASELPAMRDTLVSQHVALQSLRAERFPDSGGGGGSAADSSASRSSVHPSAIRTKAGASSAESDGEGETLSYISVRV